MNTTATTDLAALLSSQLTEHCFKSDSVTIYTDSPNPQTMQDFRLDVGGLYAGTIHGCDAALPYGGHKMPTIAEGEAIRAEIIRRWNAHTELMDALEEVVQGAIPHKRDWLITPYALGLVKAAIAKATAPTA